MKNSIAFLAFILFALPMFAQSIDIDEASRAMNNGTYNSFLFELPDVSEKEAEDDWKAFMKDFKAKTKYDRKSKLWLAEEAQMPRLSDNPVSVYARILEDSNPNKRTSVIVWFDLGESYASSELDEKKGAYAKEILIEYGITASKHHAEAIVKTEEKTLDKLEGDLKKLRNDNDDYHKAIEKAKDTIAKMEKNIEINEQDQKNKEKDIDNQKKVVVEAKDHARKFN